MNAIHFCKVDSAWSKAVHLKHSASYFSLSERSRWQSLNSSRQTQFAISRLLLRSALSLPTNAPLSNWQLQERPNKVPAVVNSTGMTDKWRGFMSISHSANYVACALSERLIGIDMEEPRTVSRWHKIAARVFTTAQQNRLNAAPTQQREAMFLQMWTAKEALFKAHSAANAPVQFMSTLPFADLGLISAHVCSRRLFASIASPLSLSHFVVYFWRSPEQWRQIIVKPIGDGLMP